MLSARPQIKADDDDSSSLPYESCKWQHQDVLSVTLFPDELDEFYFEIKLPNEFPRQLIVGFYNIRMHRDKIVRLGLSPLSFGLDVVRSELLMCVPSYTFFRPTVLCFSKHVPDLKFHPNDCIGIGLDNLSEIYITQNGRRVTLPWFPAARNFGCCRPVYQFQIPLTVRNMCLLIPQERWMFDPEKAERTPANSPILREPDWQIEVFSSVPKEVLQHVFLYVFGDEVVLRDELLNLMLVCKRWHSVVISLNNFWQKRFKQMFPFANLNMMHPTSWYALLKHRVLRARQVPLSLSRDTLQVTNCDVEECPAFLGASYDNILNRKCSQCEFTVVCTTSSKEARDAYKEGHKVAYAVKRVEIMFD